jgi:hypothetical protein
MPGSAHVDPFDREEHRRTERATGIDGAQYGEPAPALPEPEVVTRVFLELSLGTVAVFRSHQPVTGLRITGSGAAGTIHRFREGGPLQSSNEEKEYACQPIV